MTTADSTGLLAEIEAVAIDLARRASEIVLKYYSGGIGLGQPSDSVEFKDKEKRDPVTLADREVEAMFVREVKARFPSHSILGEEGAPGDPNAEYLWVVDPLDGTTNFVNHLPLWAVSIGVLRRNRPVVGAIFLPGSAELGGGVYHARLGGGAFIDDRPISVVSDRKPSPSRLVSVPGSGGGAFRFRSGGYSGGQPRTLGTAAGEVALVASGAFQYGLFRSLHLWDVAAGVIIVEEAGGSVYRWGGILARWQPLVGFTPGRATPNDPTGLRHWSEPLLMGGAGVTATIARYSRPTLYPPRPFLKAFPWLRYFWK